MCVWDCATALTWLLNFDMWLLCLCSHWFCIHSIGSLHAAQGRCRCKNKDKLHSGWVLAPMRMQPYKKKRYLYKTNKYGQKYSLKFLARGAKIVLNYIFITSTDSLIGSESVTKHILMYLLVCILEYLLGLTWMLNAIPSFLLSGSCRLHPGPGPCSANITRYFYNTSSMACESFQYGGCIGNHNNFNTEQECIQTCRTKGWYTLMWLQHSAIMNQLTYSGWSREAGEPLSGLYCHQSLLRSFCVTPCSGEILLHPDTQSVTGRGSGIL